MWIYNDRNCISSQIQPVFHLQFQYYWVEAMYWPHKLNVDLSMFSEQYFKSSIWHELNIIIAWPCCLLTLLTEVSGVKIITFLAKPDFSLSFCTVSSNFRTIVFVKIKNQKKTLKDLINSLPNLQVRRVSSHKVIGTRIFSGKPDPPFGGLNGEGIYFVQQPLHLLLSSQM